MTVADSSATSERQAYSSAEVTRNSKGFSWACKVYVPAGEEDTLPIKLAALEFRLRQQYAGDVYESLMCALELVLEEIDDDARQHSSGAVHLSTSCIDAIRAAVNLGTTAKVNA